MYDENDFSINYKNEYNNELVLINKKICLKNKNYYNNSVFIKKVIDKGNIIELNDEYNLIYKLLKIGNYDVIKYICLKYKLDGEMIYFYLRGDKIKCNNIVFIQTYIQYSVLNNNLKMLKFGYVFNKFLYTSYVENYIPLLPFEDMNILRWCIKQDKLLSKTKKYKIFNINNYFNFECFEAIRFISKYSKKLYILFDLSMMTEKKYEILLWLILNNKISNYDIDLLNWNDKYQSINKKIYELLYSININIYPKYYGKIENYKENTIIFKMDFL